MPCIHHTIWIILDLLLHFKMNERDSKGGRVDREIELGMRYVGERMEHDEHSKLSTEGKQLHFIKQHVFFSYNWPFYRVKKIENFKVKRCLENGVGSYGSYNTFSELVSCLFNDLFIT